MTKTISANYERAISRIGEYKKKCEELTAFEEEVNVRKKKLAELKKQNEEKFDCDTHDEIRKLEDALESANRALKQEEHLFKNIKKRTSREAGTASRHYFVHTMENDKVITSTKEALNELVEQGLELIATYENKNSDIAKKTIDHFKSDLGYTGGGLYINELTEGDQHRIKQLKEALKAF